MMTVDGMQLLQATMNEIARPAAEAVVAAVVWRYDRGWVAQPPSRPENRR